MGKRSLCALNPPPPSRNPEWGVITPYGILKSWQRYSYAEYFCGASKAKRHIVITLSILLSVTLCFCFCWLHMCSVEHWLITSILEFDLPVSCSLYIYLDQLYHYAIEIITELNKFYC